MKKRIIGVSLACFTAGMVFAGCGASNDTAQETTTAEETTVTTTTTTTAETTTTTEETTTTTEETTTTTETTTTAETTTARSAEAAYDWLLNKYRGIVRSGPEGFDVDDSTFPEYDISFSDSIRNHFPVSYSLVDLDGNGISELLIWGEVDLSAAYTVVNNEVRPLAFSEYRNTVKMNDDYTFYNQSSYSGFEGSYNIFRMSNDGSSLAMTDCYEYSYREATEFNKYENVSGDFFTQYDENNLIGKIPVSEDEFYSVENAHSNAYYSGNRQNL